MTKNLVLSGIQPSASQVHIGNYLGAIKHFVELQETHPLILCIVDLHAFTTLQSRDDVAEYSFSLAATYAAMGLTKESTIIFKQSDVAEVCELSWYFACQFPLGLLERAHAFKDKRSKNEQVNAGLLFYPILMAADILLYKANKVPVGADQKQHLEMAREIAEKFNHRFGTDFPLPEPLIDESTGIIPGLDGRKMSKSYDNYIGLFEDEKTLEKKVKRIVTDSKGVDDPKDPDSCNVFSLFKLFANKEEIAEMRGNYEKGGFGYGHAKLALLDVMKRELNPIKEKYGHYMSHPQEIEGMLEDGASKAREIAQGTLTEVRSAMGL